jgi:hypothetical protein
MTREALHRVILLLSIALAAAFFTSSPVELRVAPITGLSLFHRVLLVAACLLLITAALLVVPERASIIGLLGTLSGGVIWGALALWQPRSAPLVSSTMYYGSLSASFFIMAIKYFVALLERSATRGQTPARRS